MFKHHTNTIAALIVVSLTNSYLHVAVFCWSPAELDCTLIKHELTHVCLFERLIEGWERGVRFISECMSDLWLFFPFLFRAPESWESHQGSQGPGAGGRGGYPAGTLNYCGAPGRNCSAGAIYDKDFFLAFPPPLKNIPLFNKSIFK